MPRLICQLNNSLRIEYNKGSFDDWCVYVVDTTNNTKYAPTDIQYFGELQKLGGTYTSQKIYDDFISVYKLTGNTIDQPVLDLINQISSNYTNHSLDIKKWFVVIYAGMVAEENKEFTRLGKRIKRLGLHQSLIQGISASKAANYSKGKKWRDLDTEMKLLGF